MKFTVSQSFIYYILITIRYSHKLPDNLHVNVREKKGQKGRKEKRRKVAEEAIGVLCTYQDAAAAGECPSCGFLISINSS